MISDDRSCVPVMVVPILAGPDYLYRLAASIDFPVGRLLVIDNGMVVNPIMLRSAAPDCVGDTTVIPMPNNLGVAGSWNLGVKATALAEWWLIVNFDAWFPEGSVQRFADTVTDGVLTLSGGSPPWCAFGLPASVVERVGLFDERIHPAYFEDNDFAVRCRHHGVPIVTTDISVEHDNSSTLKFGYDRRNNETFEDNLRYMNRKHSMEDFSDGGYSLLRRRKLSWD